MAGGATDTLEDSKRRVGQHTCASELRSLEGASPWPSRPHYLCWSPHTSLQRLSDWPLEIPQTSSRNQSLHTTSRRQFLQDPEAAEARLQEL